MPQSAETTTGGNNAAIEVVISKLQEIVQHPSPVAAASSIEFNEGSAIESDKPSESVAENDDRNETITHGHPQPEVVVKIPGLSGQISANNTDKLLDALHKINSALGKVTAKTPISEAKPTKGATGENVYKCRQCDYWSHNKYYWKQHVDLVHNAERVYKCPFCDYAGKRSHSLKEHLVVHSNYRPYECGLCNASFRKKGHLTNHIKMHSQKNQDEERECKVCKVELSNQAALFAHLRTLHKSCSDVYMCEFCQYATCHKANMVMHMHAHGNPKTLCCNICGYQACHINVLAEHFLQVHSKSPVAYTTIQSANAQPVILMKCTECGFTAGSTDALRQHMYKHLSPDQNTKLDSDLKQSPPPPETNTPAPKLLPAPKFAYKCSECAYTCNEAYGFITHMITHKVETKTEVFEKSLPVIPGAKAISPSNDESGTQGWYQCTICGYLGQQRTIKAHIWKHSGHKDISYPMFQNGPLSIYDETPIGKSVLKNESATIREKNETSTSSESSPIEEREDASSDSRDEVEEQEVQMSDVEDQKELYVAIEQIRCSPNDEQSSEQGFKLQEISDEDRKRFQDAGLIAREIGVEMEVENGIKKEVETAGISSVHEECDDNMIELQVAVDGADVVERTAENVDQSSRAEEVGHSTVVNATELNVNDFDGIEEEVVEEIVVGEESSVDEGIGGDLKRKAEDEIEVFTVKMPRLEGEDGVGLEVEVATEIVEEEITDPNEAEEIMKALGNRRSEEEILAMLALLQAHQRDTQTKPGICNSLLTVIEQLRERSKSASDGEGTDSDDYDDDEEECSQPLRGRPPDIEEEILHKNIERTEEGYRCKICHYSSSSAVVMKSHIKLHKSKAPHECSLCDFEAKSSAELQEHMLRHCKMRTFQCKQCLAVFNYKSQLRAHIKAHSDQERKIQEAKRCDKCCEVFASMEKLAKHQKTCLKEATSCEVCGVSLKGRKPHKCRRMYKCESCDTLFPNVTLLRLHEKEHEAPENLHCEYCDFLATSTRSLKSHMKRHKNDQRFVEQPLEQYKCNLCGYVCHHLPSLKSHMWRHASDRNYSYEQTNNVINKALENSVANGSSVITFRCCQCGFESIDKTELNKHMASHRDIIEKTLEVNKGRILGKTIEKMKPSGTITDSRENGIPGKENSQELILQNQKGKPN